MTRIKRIITDFFFSPFCGFTFSIITHKALFLLHFTFIILHFTFSYAQSNTDSLIQNLKSEIINSKSDTTRINLLNTLAKEYLYTAPDTALIYAEQALAIATVIASEERTKQSPELTHIIQELIANSHHTIGIAHYVQGNYEKALFHWQKALEIRQKIETDPAFGGVGKKGISTSLGNIGNVYNAQGNYPKALSYYFKALEMDSAMLEQAQRSGNPPLAERSNRNIAIWLGNIGIVYQNQGNYPKALSYYFKALEMDSVMGNKSGIAKHLGNIGIVYWKLGNYPKALSYYFKALEMDSVMGDKSGIAIHLGNIGIVYDEQAIAAKLRQDIAESDSLFKKALDYYFKALKIDEELGDKSGIARHLGNIGIVYTEQASAAKSRQEIAGSDSLFKKALDYYFRALKIKEELGDKRGIAINLSNIGALYTEIKQYAQAEKYLQQSLALSDSIGTLDKTMAFQKSISELYAEMALANSKIENQKSKFFQLAYNHHVLYSNAKDTVFGEEKNKAVGRVEMKHEMEMEELERERIMNDELRIMNEKIARRNLLQYSLILLVLGVLFVVVLFSRRLMAKLPDKILFIKVNKAKVGFAFIFIFIMMLFESMLLFTDPYVTNYAQGAPGVILLLNALLACILFPLNFLFEKVLVKKTGMGKPVSSGGMGTMMGLVVMMVFNSFTPQPPKGGEDSTLQLPKEGVGSKSPLGDLGVMPKADSLLNTLQKPNVPDTDKVNLLNVLFLEYEYTDAGKAAEYITQALQLSEKINYYKGIAKTYSHLAFFAEDTGNYAAALSWYQKALETDSISGNKSGIATHLGNIGIVYDEQGNYPKALSYYFKALEMDSVMGNKSGIARHLGNIGIVYWNHGNYPTALSYYFKALEMDSVMGNKSGIATKLGNIGIVYWNHGNYPKALSYYFKALEMDSVLGNKSGIATHLGNIGIVYMKQGNYPKALSYYFKALEMDSVLGDKRGIAIWLDNIGIVYSEQAIAAKSRQDIAGSDSLFKKALDYYSKALKINEELGDKRGIAIDLGNIGSLYTAIKQYAQAEKYLQQSLALSDSIGTLKYTMDLEKYTCELYAQTNKWQDAYNHHVSYRAARDSVFGEEKSKAVGRVEMKHELDMAEYKKKIEEEEKRRMEAVEASRRNELQYSAIFIGFIVLLSAIIMLSRFVLPVWIIEFLTFVPFLILFEFILVLLDPQIDAVTAGAPALRLLFNAVVAGMLYPLQQFSEHKLKMLFYWKKRKINLKMRQFDNLKI